MTRVQHSPHETAVLGMLRGRTSRSPIPMPTLATALGLPTRDIQLIVKHLVEQHHEPIGSTCARGAAGYFEIRTAEDLACAERDLRHRALSCLRRLARLKAATPDEILGQLRLALTEDPA